ncbi:MAG: transcriptional regulator, partial [Stackebrandtia sp.]
MPSLVSKVVAELGLALEWLYEPHPAEIHLDAGSRIDSDLSRQISARVQRLREADDTVPGRILYPHVIAERNQVAAVLDNAYANARTRMILLSALAELEQLAGWIAADGGAHGQAQAHYLAGIRAAGEANDPVTAAQLWSCLAYMLTGLGDVVDGLFVAQAAQRRGEQSSPLVACLLAERHAYAAAAAADSYACHMA